MATNVKTEDLKATVLRRIADALDGIRTGEKVWVVFEPDQPYEVRKVTPKEADASAMVDPNVPQLKYTGPFQTAEPVRADGAPALVLFCHTPDSDWCPDGEVPEGSGIIGYVPPGSALRAPDDKRVAQWVEEIRVSWKTNTGHEASRVFRWEPAAQEKPMVDAVFFSLAALDKFYFPHLSKIHGQRRAFEARGRVEEMIKRNPRARNMVADLKDDGGSDPRVAAT